MSIKPMTVESALRGRIDKLENTLRYYDRRMNTRAVDEDRKRISALESALADMLPMIEENDPEKLPAIESLLAKKICL